MSDKMQFVLVAVLGALAAYVGATYLGPQLQVFFVTMAITYFIGSIVRIIR